MRKEFAEYIKGLPISFNLANIMEYPLHWKDSIEILFVLKGTVEVDIESKTYIMRENDIEILNPDEIFRISSKDPDNIVLILDIDPGFFEEYYSDAKDTFYYSGSKELEAQSGEKYHILRRLIAILYYESMIQLDDYTDAVEKNLLILMYHLLNNFHYLFYIEESLKDDAYQLKRYHRIVKYLSNNYMNKITLQDIAIQEFLDSRYLSFKIKDTLGLGFNDYLNQIRIEKSKKLLLNSDKSISEISEEVGFSHVRYYNKHFKMHYTMTPMQYRKKNTDNELIKQKKTNYLKLEEAIPFMENLLRGYDRYNHKSKTKKIDVDLNSESNETFLRPDVLDLGNCVNLLEFKNRNTLKQIQKHINFKYCLADNLFSEEMNIYRYEDCRLISWNKVRSIVDFVLEQGLIPIINTLNVQKYIIDDFIQYFTKTYDTDASKWLDTNYCDLKKDLSANVICHHNDTMYIVPYILHSFIHKNRRIVPKIIDEIVKDTVFNNDTFIGDNGLLTINYLKKPLFYAFWFLSLLGDKIIYKSTECLVTKSDTEYCILLYDPREISDEVYNSCKVHNKCEKKEQKISLNVYNMLNDFRVIKYELTKESCSIYDKWIDIGKPRRLDDHSLKLLSEYTGSTVSFYNIKKSPVVNFVTKLKEKEAVLYILKNV